MTYYVDNQYIGEGEPIKMEKEGRYYYCWAGTDTGFVEVDARTYGMLGTPGVAIHYCSISKETLCLLPSPQHP